MEMSAMCQFQLANETFAAASLDYLRPESAATHGDDRIRVAGTTGVVEVRDSQVWLTNGEAEGTRELEAACDRQIFQDFTAQVQGRSQALIGPDDVFAVTEACLRARDAADTGSPQRFGAMNS